MISGDAVSSYPISGYSQPEVSSGTLFFQSISASITRTAAIDKTIVFNTSISADVTRSATLSTSSVFSSTISAAISRLASVGAVFMSVSSGEGSFMTRLGMTIKGLTKN